MAVSLISTGVQFPDSTIQTTAATAGAAPGMVLLQTYSPSAVTVVNVEGFVNNSLYQAYSIFYQLTVSGSVIRMQFKCGGSYQTGSTYTYTIVRSDGLAGSTTTDRIDLTLPGLTVLQWGNFMLWTPTGTTYGGVAQTTFPTFGNAIYYQATGFRYINGTSQAFEGFRLYTDSVNMTGKVYVYGVVL
jgi:hypothetical protein